MFTSSEVALLLQKYIDGTMLPAEQQRLALWLEEDADHRSFFEKLLEDESLLDDYGDWLAARELRSKSMIDDIKAMTLERIQQIPHSEGDDASPAGRAPSAAHRWSLLAALSAAAVLLVVGLWVGYSTHFAAPQQHSSSSSSNPVDLEPASNHTTLTLSNGTQVQLRQDQQSILLDGGISYGDGSDVLALAGEDLSTLQATIEVPRGSTYRVALADGSQVVLNALSTLTYPLAFADDRREVHLSGEGYFDIVPYSRKGHKVPFLVHTDKQQVLVTGTQFNIKAYRDDKYTVSTLIEGAISVSHGPAQVALRPNQQALAAGDAIRTVAVQGDSYIAWTKQKFLFQETELADVLQQISRWYNVDIHDIPGREEMFFYGEIANDRKLSEVLHMLEKSGVRLKLHRRGQHHHLHVQP